MARALMVVHRLTIALLLAGTSLCSRVHSQAADASQSAGDTSSAPSSQTIHRKTGPDSSETIRHTRVVEEGSVSPELTRAEDLIQKRDYAGSEALLRKV